MAVSHEELELAITRATTELDERIAAIAAARHPRRSKAGLRWWSTTAWRPG